MKIQPTNNVNFGIYKGYKKTSYGECIWGVYKNLRIDIYNAPTHEQKLYYVSDNKFFNWVKSKLKCYKGRQVVKIIRSENDNQQS